MKRAPLFVVLLAALADSPACSKSEPDDGTRPAVAEELPPLALRDDTPNLMLTWVDERGDTHVELKPTDVPESGRAQVRVVVSDREAGTKGTFYVADLTKKAVDGTYAVTTMPRREWERLIEKRREEYLAKAAPKPPPDPATAAPPSPSAPPASPGQPAPAIAGVSVIIYGADWCKPCHEAEAYLRKKGVRVVMKDVEESPEAAREMQEKLRRSGRNGGSIPVIDVRGQILVGFSPKALDRAVAKVAGTVL